MPHEVVVLPSADRDFQAVYDWLRERSKPGADRWANAFLDALSRLEDHPEGYGLAPEDRDHPETIRQFLFKTRRGRTYRALFTVSGDRVYVLHIRGPGQQAMPPAEVEKPSFE